nr:PAS domain S-box protein [Opitutaceae bacterium]
MCGRWRELQDSALWEEAPEAGRKRSDLVAFLDILRVTAGGETVLVYDAGGRIITSAPRGSHGHDAKFTARPRWPVGDGVDFIDLHLNDDGHAHLAYVGRIPGAGSGAAARGEVLLAVRTEDRLHDIAFAWPFPTESGEIVLFRRDEGDLTLIAPTRSAPDAALSRKISASDLSVLAAKALASGEPGLVSALDYRGVPVVGVLRAVPGTPWFVVAKIDAAEAYAAARRRALEIFGGFALVAAIAVLAFQLIWRRREQAQLIRALELERERRSLAERLGLVLSQARDGILLFDREARVVEANDRARELYEHPRDKLLGLPAGALRAPAAQAATAEDFQRVMEGGSLLFETLHVSATGRVFPVEVSTQRVEIGGEPHVLSIVRDITARREQERRIAELDRLHLLASRETRRLVPVAMAGPHSDYARRIRVSVDEAAPEGGGPAGIAFREKRPVACHDFLGTPTAEPWHQAALDHGLASVLALPLLENGRPVAVLAVYSQTAGFFTEDRLPVLVDVAANLSFLLGVLADLDRRFAAEAGLAERQELLGAIFEQAVDGIVLVDEATGAFLEFNTAAHQTLGYTREEFAKLRVGDIQATETMADIRRNIDLVKAGQRLVFDTAHRRKNGEVRDTRVSARALSLRDRPCIVAVWADMTDSRRLQRELARTEELFRTIADNVSDIIWVFDLVTDRYRYLSPAVKSFAGHPPEAYQLLSLTDCLSPADAARARRMVDDWLAEPAATRDHAPRNLGEFDHRHADGGHRRGEVSAAVIPDDTGRPALLVGVTRDVSERHRTEARLHQLSSVVEQSPAAI